MTKSPAIFNILNTYIGAGAGIFGNIGTDQLHITVISHDNCSREYSISKISIRNSKFSPPLPPPP